jgi:hypothetical protein
MEGRQYISAALGRVFAITLEADKANPSADPPVLLLNELAQVGSTPKGWNLNNKYITALVPI